MKFEKVSRFKDVEFDMPVRKTAQSAGYDMAVAEDAVVPPYKDLMLAADEERWNRNRVFSIDEVAVFNKCFHSQLPDGSFVPIKPTLVSTGVKCQLDKGYYLELSVRSSSPLKYWLVLANGIGIIDADYYQNPDNEGEIYFQLINLSPYPIQLKKGDIIGQGIIKKYYTLEDDSASGERMGGFGSTENTYFMSVDTSEVAKRSKEFDAYIDKALGKPRV